MRLVLGLLFLFALDTSSSATTYCLCRDGIGEKELQTSIDYACGVLRDCTPIHVKGPCYQPNTVKSHCDWAVNTYFQISNQVSGSCNFSGTATTTPNLPSTVVTGCIYPSSPESAGTTSTNKTQAYSAPPTFGPSGDGDSNPSENNRLSASSLCISIAIITLGFSVIAFL